MAGESLYEEANFNYDTGNLTIFLTPEIARSSTKAYIGPPVQPEIYVAGFCQNIKGLKAVTSFLIFS